jgi:hypothetical protein
MKLEISRDDYEFLKGLQHELNTQTTDGNAQPVFWGVSEVKTKWWLDKLHSMYNEEECKKLE